MVAVAPYHAEPKAPPFLVPKTVEHMRSNRVLVPECYYPSSDHNPTQPAYANSATNNESPTVVQRLISPRTIADAQGRLLLSFSAPDAKSNEHRDSFGRRIPRLSTAPSNGKEAYPPLSESAWDRVLSGGCYYYPAKLRDPAVDEDEGGDLLTTALKQVLENTVGRLFSEDEVRNEQGKLAVTLASFIDKKFNKDWDKAFETYATVECASGNQQRVMFFHQDFKELLNEAQYTGPLIASGEHVAKLMLSPGSNAATREEFKALQRYRDQDRAYVRDQIATKLVPFLAEKHEGNWYLAYMRYAAADHSSGTTKLELLESGLQTLFKEAHCGDLLSIPERKSQIMGSSLTYIDFISLLSGGPTSSAVPVRKVRNPRKKK